MKKLSSWKVETQSTNNILIALTEKMTTVLDPISRENLKSRWDF